MIAFIRRKIIFDLVVYDFITLPYLRGMRHERERRRSCVGIILSLLFGTEHEIPFRKCEKRLVRRKIIFDLVVYDFITLPYLRGMRHERERRRSCVGIKS